MRPATYRMSEPPPHVSISQAPITPQPNSQISANLHAKLSLPVHQKSPDPQNYQSFSVISQQREKEMMNLLALGLVLTSLVTAGFFTPSPEKHKPEENVIVKEGHRVVVVEYEKDDGNTKVSISPQDSHKVDELGFASKVNDKMSERIENVKESMKEAASSLIPDSEKAEISQSDGNNQRFRPRELACDAYGKCKHKIASVMGKTREAVEEKAHDAAERVSDAASGAVGRVKDTVAQTAHIASEKVQEVKENVKDSASEAAAKTKEKMSGIKEEASRKIEGAKETAKEAGEWVEDASDKAKEGAKKVKNKGKKELSEIMHHAREVAADVFDYVASADRVAPVTGVLHMMGFAAAYGMCVWVTFASSQVLAGALPRQQFAMVQSKIYPVYFKAMAYSVGMALLGHLMSPRRSLSGNGVGFFQGFNLMAALGMILVNLMYLEPRATKVMLERMKREKEEGKEGQTTEPIGRAPDSAAETVGRVSTTTHEAAAKSQMIRLSEALQRLNSYSSFLNAMTLVSLTWHLVRLGPRLHAVCM